MKFGLQCLVLTGAMCLSSALSNAQLSKLDSSTVQSSNFSAVNFEEGDYFYLDSTKMAEIKNKEYPYFRNKPIRDGITAYVFEQWESAIYDFQKFFNVWIYSLDFEVASLNQENGKIDRKGNVVIATNIPKSDLGDELGAYHLGSDYVTISNEEKYLGYSLKTAKKTVLRDILSTNKFVRAVILHEIAHDYIQQTGAELRMEGYAVNPAFFNRSFSTPQSIFLEEGIAEYCPTAMGELIQGEMEIPKSIEDMFDKKQRWNFYYNYSVHFVQDFLKEKGLRDGVRILLSNSPPTDTEIFNSELYFNRLNLPKKMKEQ